MLIFHIANFSFLRRTHLKGLRAKQRNLSSGSAGHFGDAGITAPRDTLLCSQAVRLYSTSSRNVLKTEPPIGLYREEKPSLQLSLLGVRLGESFQRLSRHINFYFRQKDLTVAQHAGNSAFVYTFHEPQRRQQRRVHSQRSVKDRRPLEDLRGQLRSVAVIDAPAQQHEEQTAASRLYAGLQLFHISSLATRFGESYSYVANHINSVFSTSPARDIHAQAAEDGSHHQAVRHGRRRKTLHVAPTVSQPPVHAEVTHGIQKEEAKAAEYPSSWEEGYLHFASHVNRYFAAKVSDSVSSTTESKQSSQPLQPKSPGLFHMSNTATSFGANHAQMANHINHYFNGQHGFEDDLDGDYMDNTLLVVASTEQEKPVTFMQSLLNTTAAIPNVIGNYLGVSSKSQEAQVSPRDIPTQPRVVRPVSHHLPLQQRAAATNQTGKAGAVALILIFHACWIPGYVA